MSLFKQPLLDLHGKLIVDLFAGGGGASSGIEEALGRPVDIAINHDQKAISMHEANHPQTKHYRSDVFEVDPRLATGGRPVGLAWFSPDCTYYSKARGSKPIRSSNKRRRALAWIVLRWAGTVKPDVIMLENVEEFASWGPLVGPKDELRPCTKRRGKTFKVWLKQLRALGYEVEWKELRACDYGAPTIRKRLFIIARSDGQPIVWPQPTHGDPKSEAVKSKRLKPFRTAAECIDWTIPMCSIFATKEEAKDWGDEHGQAAPIRPLSANTMRRTARGVQKFVIENKNPFLITITNVGDGRWGAGSRSTDLPLPTATCKAEHALVAPFFVPRYGEADGQKPRCMSVNKPSPVIVPTGNGASLVAAHIETYYGHKPGAGVRGSKLDEPVATQTTENRHALVAAFFSQNNGGFYDGPGHAIDKPLSTILVNSRGHHGLMACHIQRDFSTSTGHEADQPVGTITCEGGGKAALVASFLTQYNGTSEGQSLTESVNTITSRDRFGLVTLTIKGQPYFISDICMRMLQPKELYACQGFRPGYIIDAEVDGKKLTKSDQVRMCGNSVSPQCAKALVLANVAELYVRSAS